MSSSMDTQRIFMRPFFGQYVIRKSIKEIFLRDRNSLGEWSDNVADLSVYTWGSLRLNGLPAQLLERVSLFGLQSFSLEQFCDWLSMEISRHSVIFIFRYQ